MGFKSLTTFGVKGQEESADRSTNVETEVSRVDDEDKEEKKDWYEGVVWVDPGFVVDGGKCMTLKFNMERLMRDTRSPMHIRTLLCLLNRRRNKHNFLRYLKEQLLSESLSLIDVSALLLKVNSVYKQAGAERAQIKKRD